VLEGIDELLRNNYKDIFCKLDQYKLRQTNLDDERHRYFEETRKLVSEKHGVSPDDALTFGDVLEAMDMGDCDEWARRFSM
jgi:hypothetical protein